MRVALFTYGTQPRGGVVHTLSLGHALHDLGHEVCVFALDKTGGGFFREPSCPYALVPVAIAPGDIVATVRDSIDAYVAALLEKTLEFEVYHAQDGISGNALATLVERGKIRGFARTVHHADDFPQAQLAALQERSIVSASRAFVVSAHWQRLIRQRFGIAASVVPSGVDLARFTPVSPIPRRQIRARFEVGTAPLFVSIGGIEARKNTIGTLEAFALVRATQPAARLIIAGGASVFDHSVYGRRFDARAAELGLRIGSDVIVTGVVDDGTIVDLLRACDALVFPSLVEGFGLVLLEALACGRPVVASAIAPFTEFLTPDDALLVDPCDTTSIARAMLRALDPSVARQAARRGPQLAARHSWHASARAHIERYRERALFTEECVRA